MRRNGLTRLLLACAMVLAGSAVASVSSAAASPELAYNNLNTVPATVNGKPDEDTYSQDYEAFMGAGMFGGQIETVNTNNRLVKSLETNVDVFACEHGEYQLENCYTTKPNKHFTQEWTAKIYTVGAGEEPGALVATGSVKAKLHYRPTTNTTCPSTSEGKGFGPNCDVGGYLQTVTIKKFTQSTPLPARVIVLLTNGCEACGGKIVNVGLQTAYKEGSGSTFVGEPPADSGQPAVGSDPRPESIYYNSHYEATGWAEYQPVFKLEVR